MDTTSIDNNIEHEVIINQFRRRDFIFIEGYYSAFKILVKLAKEEIPIESKYLNDVNESKITLINPIMFLGHHFIELSIKRYLSKLSDNFDKVHNIEKLYLELENLWFQETKNLSVEYWIQNKWINGYKIKDRFKALKNIIVWFNKIDKSSTNFRYSDTVINENINLNTLEAYIDNLYDFFEDLNLALDIVQTNKKTE